MTLDQRISDIRNLLNAEIHLRNKSKKKRELDHGYISAHLYLKAVSCDKDLSERIKNIWENEGSEAARREVLRLAWEVSQ